MKARKRPWWIPVGAIVVIAAVFIAAGFALMRPNEPPEMKWKFLGGEQPAYMMLAESGWLAEGGFIDSATDPAYRSLARKGPAVNGRLQTYRFRADYATIVAAARKEVLARGGVEDTTPGAYKELSTFHCGDDWQIYISRSTHGPLRGQIDSSAPFVSVKVGVYRKENFAGVARRWIRSIFH